MTTTRTEPTTTLIDGRTVSTYSIEWLEECRLRELEARAVLKMATLEIRREHIRKYGVEHGEEARKRLEGVVRDLWSRRA